MSFGQKYLYFTVVCLLSFKTLKILWLLSKLCHVFLMCQLIWKCLGQEFGRQTVNTAGLWIGWAVLNFLCCVDCSFFIQYFPLKYQFIIDDSDVSDVYLLSLDWTCKQMVKKSQGLEKMARLVSFLLQCWGASMTA